MNIPDDHNDIRDENPVVFVVDDDALIRETLVQLLLSEGIAARAYPTATAFLDAYRRETPGCLLLDIGLPDIDGLELQALLSARQLEIPVVFLSGSANVSKTIRAFNQGAIDFIEKPAGKEVLLERIRQALDVDRRQRAVALEQSSIQRRYDRLTPRERVVLGLLVAGYSSKGMGSKLGISQRTIEGYRRRVFEKMATKSLLSLHDMVRAIAKVDPNTTIVNSFDQLKKQDGMEEK